MLELAGPLAVAALVLAVGGGFKLLDPAPTRAMWTTFGVRGRGAFLLAVAAGVIELVLGSATFLVGGRVLALATAAAFGVFAVLAAQLVRRDAAPCGCFGKHSGRTTRLHVIVDTVVAAVALAAAVVDAPGVLTARSELPGAGIAFIGFAMLGAWFVIATLTVLPEALAAAQRAPRSATVRTFEITGSP